MAFISPNAQGAISAGQVVVDLGGDVWVPWAQGQSLTGHRIGIAQTGNVPGGSFVVIVDGPVPYSLLNLGGGNSSYVIAGTTPARQLTANVGQVIGYCDPAGTVEVYPSYVGNLPFTLLPPAPTPSTLVERGPLDVTFSNVFKQVWFGGTVNSRLMPPALQWVNDNFSNTNTSRFTTHTESVLGTFSIANSVLSINAQTNANEVMTLLSEGNAINAPQFCAMVTVVNTTGTNGAYKGVLLGVAQDGNNYVVMNWDQVAKKITVQTKLSGTSQFSNANFNTTAWTYPAPVAVSLVGNCMSVYGYQANAWTLCVAQDLTLYSTNVSVKNAALANWYPSVGFSTPGTQINQLNLANFAAGRFGGVGVRDICVVTNPNGTVTPNTNPVYALATLAGPASGIAEASCGVFQVDLNQKTYTQTAVIMVSRNGNIQNDHAGHISIDNAGNQRVCLSTWGDIQINSTRVEYALVPSSTNLLSGLNVINATELNLTVSGSGNYDPFLIQPNNSGNWLMAYTVTGAVLNQFYPALDQTADINTFTNVGSDNTALRYEGTRLCIFNGAYYLLAGGQTNMKVYSASTTALSYLGIMNLMSPGAAVTQPHPMFFPYNNTFVCLTFDDTTWPASTGAAFSWGDIQWYTGDRWE